MNRSHEYGLVMFEKGQEDLYVFERLANDPQAPPAAVGFHAQQAVEKFLKAVLSSRAVTYPRTHDLAMLLDLLRDHALPLPPHASQLPVLSPYGARLRYDRPLPAEDIAPLDRQWAHTCVREVRAWAERLLAEQKKPPQKP